MPSPSYVMASSNFLWPSDVCFHGLGSPPLDQDSSIEYMIFKTLPPASKRFRNSLPDSLPDSLISTGCSGWELQASLWNKLPEELFERVLAHLPIHIFFRFRSVCKGWNASIYSQSFLGLCAQVPPKGPWFYTITNENVDTSATYDPQENKWFNISLPSFLQKKGVVFPVASGGGLICFLDIDLQHFFMSNPLMKSFLELPSRTIKWWSRKAVGMAVDNETRSYKLIWVDSSGDYEVYDSTENRWRSGFLPRVVKVPLSLNFRSQPINVEGALYFTRTKPDGLILYKTKTDKWEELQVPLPPSSLDTTLAECKGRILMVGLIMQSDVSCVCIWELQRMTLLWVEVDRMPNGMLSEFAGKQMRMTCLGNKDLLLLALRCKQLNRLVLYDVANRRWVRVPSCFLPNASRQSWITCGTSFEPSLSALASEWSCK